MISRLVIFGLIPLVWFNLLITATSENNGNLMLSNQDALRREFQSKFQNIIPAQQEELHDFKPFVDFIVNKLQVYGLRDIILDSQNRTTIINHLNSLIGGKILHLKENHIQIDYKELSARIKGALELKKRFGKDKIKLYLAERIWNGTVDFYLSQFEELIKASKFSSQNTKDVSVVNLATSTEKNAIIREVVLEVISQCLRPLQPELNRTLTELRSGLSNYYRTELSSGFLSSIRDCTVNQAILRIAQMIDSAKTTINSVSTTNELRISRVTPRSHVIVSLLNVIFAPIRFLLAIFLTPIRKILMNTVDVVIVHLRPFVGKLVLMPLENLLKTIIGLIPCLKC